MVRNKWREREREREFCLFVCLGVRGHVAEGDDIYVCVRKCEERECVCGREGHRNRRRRN